MVIADSWKALAPRARFGLAAGVLLIVCSMAGLGLWAYRADYQVLFSDVAAADAAAMTAELDKLKTPYQLADGGATILVPKDLVYKTRLKLMGKEMPLHGAVGFEVFNNADFGMTEFVQKVNYQRAIQGELTRTILAIEEVQAARVHLAIPEQGLFKKSLTRPKASVTLTMKKDRVLAPEQVAGIQRLVAASVPDIASADVTVLNQHGIALTRNLSAEAGGDGGSAALEAKRGTEEYLARKVSEVLDHSFGPGVAVASVDVVLNLDQSRVTTEEVLPAKAQAGAAVGVVVRERRTLSDAGELPLGTPARSLGNQGNSTTEADYQVGRRVEQLVPASGGIRRMTVAVLMRQQMNEDQVAKLKEVVMLAVGYNEARGDAVMVYPMSQFEQVGARTAQEQPAEEAVPAAPAQPQAAAAGKTAVVLAALAAAVALLALAWRLLRPRRRQALAPVAVPARLTADERARMVSDIRQWIAGVPGNGASK
jgi:flagellar M-ring protein FliF